MKEYVTIQELLAKGADTVIMKRTFPGKSGQRNQIQADIFTDMNTSEMTGYRSGKNPCMTETFHANERLILLGAGHVSRCVASIAANCGFEVLVIDDRPEFADEAFFPEKAKVICSPIGKAIHDLTPRREDYFVIVTRGHAQDTECIEAIFSHKETRYVGLMGSRKRVKGLFETLQSAGFDKDRLSKIHTPIGLSIGAKTPNEIAVSIIAELIQVRHEAGISEFDQDEAVLYNLSELQKHEEKPFVLATVLKTEGSTPRSAGARMIIFEQEQIGTIGGGCVEAMALTIGRRLLRSGSYEILEVDINGRKAVARGAQCGGVLTVLLEDMN